MRGAVLGALALAMPLAGAVAPADVVVTGFHVEGYTGLVVCTFQGPMPCMLLQDSEGAWNPGGRLEHRRAPWNLLSDLAPGTPIRLRGTLAWDALTPLSSAMTLFLQDGTQNYASVGGPSPLGFEWDLQTFGGSNYNTNIHDGQFVHVGPVFLLEEWPQEFVFEGEITSVV